MTYRDILKALQLMDDEQLDQRAVLRPYNNDGDAVVTLMPIFAFGALRVMESPEAVILATDDMTPADRASYALYNDIAGGGIAEVWSQPGEHADE